MKLTVEKWLQRIADPVIRESALRQMDDDSRNNKKESLAFAILDFTTWFNTREGGDYWLNLWRNPPALLPLSASDAPLYQHMADKHGLTLTESELSDIVDVVKGMI